MLPIILSIATFFSTLAGGLTALRNQKMIRLIMGYTAGVLLGVVAFDLLPEIAETSQKNGLNFTHAMLALVAGFLVFHILEKTILLHHSHEGEYDKHTHPHVGIASALALSGHSFLDGVGIGLGFQVDNRVGVAVAIAVIAHDFSDGLNTVVLLLRHKNSRKRAFKFLLVDAFAPVLGAASTLLFSLPNSALALYLGFFAGFLLYIGASDILPQAHSKGSSKGTIVMTVVGTVFIFVVTRFSVAAPESSCITYYDKDGQNVLLRDCAK
jgi:zinc transporter ZupT